MTASHVLAACLLATPFQLGRPYVIGTVATNHPTHDVALAKYFPQEQLPQDYLNLIGKPLEPESSSTRLLLP